MTPNPNPGRRGQESPADSAEDISARGESSPTNSYDTLEGLLPVVYEELRRIAHARLLAEPAGHTLNTTALVHEAYLKLVDQTQVKWTDRTHVLAMASIAMRRILVDYARKHRAAKRGGEWQRVPLDAAELSVEARAEALIELDQALTRLAGVDERLSRVVECRFFGGMTEEETAEVLGVTSRTVRSYWDTARGLLYLELSAP